MEPNNRKVLLPPDICTSQQKINKLSNSVETKLKDMLNNAEQKSHDVIKNALSEYQEKTQIYKEKIQSNIQIIAGFESNYIKLTDDNYTAKNMYIELIAAIYDRIRKDANEYCDFLQKIKDPIIYFEKQKQLKQTKFMKNTLGNGSFLPSIKLQEYNDNVPRRRAIKTHDKLYS